MKSFPGTIHVITSEEQAEGACRRLAGESIVGVDTESRPSFVRGQMYPISLVQVATHTDAYLFRVAPGRVFRALEALLEDPVIRKVAQGAPQEVRDLRAELGIEARGFIDLPSIAKAAGVAEINLRAVAASVLGVRVTKSAQRSNWARQTLTPAQQCYAATDAWVCLAAYEKLAQRVRLHGPGAVIRKADAADARVLIKLIRELAGGENSALSPGYVRICLPRPGFTVLLAEHGGHSVGLVSFSIRPNLFHSSDVCLIEELVVTRTMRRRGIGRALLLAAVAEAESQGCAEISVSTTSRNEAARQLYRQAGFTDEALLLERHFTAAGRPAGRRRDRRRRTSGQVPPTGGRAPGAGP